MGKTYIHVQKALYRRELEDEFQKCASKYERFGAWNSVRRKKNNYYKYFRFLKQCHRHNADVAEFKLNRLKKKEHLHKMQMKQDLEDHRYMFIEEDNYPPNLVKSKRNKKIKYIIHYHGHYRGWYVYGRYKNKNAMSCAYNKLVRRGSSYRIKIETL